MIDRVKVAFPRTEYEALLDLADAELRPVQEQIRYLVRQELQRRGLLAAETQQTGATEGQ